MSLLWKIRDTQIFVRMANADRVQWTGIFVLRTLKIFSKCFCNVVFLTMNNVCISKLSCRDICQITFETWKRKKKEKRKVDLYLYLAMTRTYDLWIEGQRFYHLSYQSIVVHLLKLGLFVWFLPCQMLFANGHCMANMKCAPCLHPDN